MLTLEGTLSYTNFLSKFFYSPRGNVFRIWR